MSVESRCAISLQGRCQLQAAVVYMESLAKSIYKMKK